MPSANGVALNKTQRRYLTVLRSGPRAFHAFDATYAALERRGFVRRLGGLKHVPMRANLVIEWEITAEGLAMLGD